MAGSDVATTPAVTRRAQARLGIALVAPLVVLVGLFFLIPLGSAVYFSLVDFHPRSCRRSGTT
jgi:raffinose/stachyose/melibiose transport system permease protein